MGGVAEVLPIQVGSMAVLIPPGACVVCGTVVSTFIVIVVLSAELHVVVKLERVSRIARIQAHTQNVQRLLVADAEAAVFGVSPVSLPVPQLHS